MQPSQPVTTDELLASFVDDESFAIGLDETDALKHHRDRFHIPKRPDGKDVIYLAGNSLGLQPTTVRSAIEQELDDWSRLAVDAHFDGKNPWYPYHEMFRESAARLVGAVPGECVIMNSLTVNLHLMMVSFYRPTEKRFKIVMEDGAFPSDTYAIKTQLRFHGFDPADGLILLKPREGEHTLRTEDIVQTIERHGDEIALVMISGVNFFTGQVFDMRQITHVAKNCGCVVGWDLAHAAGNVPLRLHDWGVDFAAWCNYKYLNAGPGAVAGCYVHDSHGRNTDLVRFGGWWGNDPETRFKMHLLPDFHPRPGADGWQISNPPIMAMAPVKASIDIFDEVGMDALREKSLRLTGYLQFLLDRHTSHAFEVITPREPAARGCQLSILVHDKPRDRFEALQKQGVVSDFRQPNVIRVAPVPLYNTFRDVWTFAHTLTKEL